MEYLPTEILEQIFEDFDGCALIKLSKVCKRWHNIINNNDLLWKNICLCNELTKDYEFEPLSDEEKSHEWKNCYRKYFERCKKWASGSFNIFEKGGDSWFYQGWASYENICLLPTYEDNTVDVFKITGESLDLEQTISIPVPGLEPALLRTNIKYIFIAKSNIILFYERIYNVYILVKMLACTKNEGMVYFTGDCNEAKDVKEFIELYYKRCKMTRVIEYKYHVIWVCDYDNDKIYINDRKNERLEILPFKSVIYYRAAFDLVCFWTSDKLSLYNALGNFLFEVVRSKFDVVSFSEDMVGMRETTGKFVELWNIHTHKTYGVLNLKYPSSILVHKETIFTLKRHNNLLSCVDIPSRTVIWSLNPYNHVQKPFSGPRITKEADFTKLFLLLNKYLLIFPVHRFTDWASFTLLNWKTGKFIHVGEFSGMLVEVNDRFLVTLSTAAASYDQGSNIIIRSYV